MAFDFDDVTAQGAALRGNPQYEAICAEVRISHAREILTFGTDPVRVQKEVDFYAVPRYNLEMARQEQAVREAAPCSCSVTHCPHHGDVSVADLLERFNVLAEKVRRLCLASCRHGGESCDCDDEL